MATRQRRSDIVTMILGVALLAMVLWFAVYTYKTLDLAQSSLDSQKTSLVLDAQDRCVASLAADYFVAIKRALAAPPAPNPERSAAIVDLDTTAERIRNRVKICEDGRVSPYVPAPAVKN